MESTFTSRWAYELLYLLGLVNLQVWGSDEGYDTNTMNFLFKDLYENGFFRYFYFYMNLYKNLRDES